ncbi:hypothetical protein [Pseudomonas sp.]|uniref:hypothetical protein n=1 Tax=Pseudomonas sp. TaxID=306 RepID=UPI002BC62C0B|nr:hypothetical protein [Pseudomonas sp.]HUE94005.1 hypothetical protein [Pseudomonas sp.]
MSQLPEPVLQAMQRGEHDQAIRMLSLNQGISQEAAQEQMNLYLEENPPVRLRGAGIVALSRTNALIWLGLIVLMVVVYLLLAS